MGVSYLGPCYGQETIDAELTACGDLRDRL